MLDAKKSINQADYFILFGYEQEIASKYEFFT